MEKPGKKKKKGKTRQDLDGRIHRLAGSIGQGGRVLFGVRTRDQEFASKSINLGSFSLVCIRFQSSYDLCQPTFSFSPFSPTSIPDTVIFRLLPVTRYTPPPSVFFPILCIVTCILSLSVTDFFFYPHCSWSRLDMDNWTPPFSRHLWGDFVGESEDSLFLSRNEGKIFLRFFY